MTISRALIDAANAFLGLKAPAPESPVPIDPTDFTSDEALADLEAFLCQRFRVVVRVKDESVVMQGVAAAFGVAEMLGANVPTSEEFLTRFATTLGPVVFLPKNPPTGKRRARLIWHEIGHGFHFWEAPLFMPRAYVQSAEKRAAYEAEAERGAIEGAWLQFGELPTAEAVHGFMQHGYAAPPPDVTLAQQLVDAAATACASGVITSPVGLAIRDWRLAKERGER